MERVEDARNQTKCSECRRQKTKVRQIKAENRMCRLMFLQCMPRDREWEKTGQKCDNCKRHDHKPCGPNYKKSEDPLQEVTTSGTDGPLRDIRPVFAEPSGEGDHDDLPPLDTENPEPPRKRVKLSAEVEEKEVLEKTDTL